MRKLTTVPDPLAGLGEGTPGREGTQRKGKERGKKKEVKVSYRHFFFSISSAAKVTYLQCFKLAVRITDSTRSDIYSLQQ